jgi:peptidoglycan/xylan/chitin deacetylase (PgdA/CDA1 family)
MSGAGVPILMYHEVAPDPHPAFRRYTVGAREFARQMGWLAARGYQAIDMDTLHRARTGGGPLPPRPVLITFDDGFQGCADHAVPVLRAYGFTAVFYLVADHVGGSSRWMLPEVGMELPLMSWDTARKLIAEGFRCGAHTATHPRLAGLDPARCRSELEHGRGRLESELGQPVLHLAYPFGSYDSAARAMAAEAGYLTACSTGPGLSAPDDDLLALHRVTVYGHDSLLDFGSRVRTGSGLRERIGRAFGGLLGGRGSPR